MKKEKTGINRRNFLKTGAAATVGVTAGSLALKAQEKKQDAQKKGTA